MSTDQAAANEQPRTSASQMCIYPKHSYMKKMHVLGEKHSAQFNPDRELIHRLFLKVEKIMSLPFVRVMLPESYDIDRSILKSSGSA